MTDNYTDRFDFSEALAGTKPAQPLAEAHEPPVIKPESSAPTVVSTHDDIPPVSGRLRKVSGKKLDKAPDEKTSYVTVLRTLVSTVRAMIPAGNTSDALSAYLYITLGRNIPVPARIKEIADEYSDDAGVSDLQRDIVGLRKQVGMLHEQLGKMSQQNAELQAALLWLVGEKMGYGVKLTVSPDKMDFLFPEHDGLARRVRQQAIEYENARKMREGREIYDARFRKDKP